MTNSERRITRVRAAVSPPGEARPDWAIGVDFARRLAARVAPERSALFPYATPEALFDEHRATTRGRDLDISGLSYARLERDGPTQWPCPAQEAPPVARLYAKGVFPTPSGRARFHLAAQGVAAETPDADYPYVLNTGRLRDQWHGMTRTGRVASLFAHAPEPRVAVHPLDIIRAGLKADDYARVRTRHGAATLRVEADEGLRPGGIFIPMHWGSQWWSGNGVNGLTLAAVDPVSRQPALKASCAALEPVTLPWRLVAMRGCDDTAQAEQCLGALRGLLGHFDTASCVRFGHRRGGVVLRAAHASLPPQDTLQTLLGTLGLAQDQVTLRYEDSACGVSRLMRLEDERLLAVCLSGRVEGHDWLADGLDSGEPVPVTGPRLVQPGASPPAGLSVASPQLCSCRQVTLAQLEQALPSALRSGDAFEHLRQTTGCASVCGSCGPEIRRYLATARTGSPAAVLS